VGFYFREYRVYKEIDSEPTKPLVSAGRLSPDALKSYRKTSFCDKTVSPTPGVFIKANSRTGKVWVLADGGSRTLLEHVRIFERNLIEMLDYAEQSY